MKVIITQLPRQKARVDEQRENACVVVVNKTARVDATRVSASVTVERNLSARVDKE